MRKLVYGCLVVSLLGALTGGIGAGIAGAQPVHVVTIDDVTFSEGSGNTTATATVAVHVDPAPEVGEQVKVDFGTSAQSAQGATATSSAAGDSSPEFPEDFGHTDGTITFNALETSSTLSVPILSDNADEPDETFFVRLFNARGECLLSVAPCDAGASIDDDLATVTITDDDAAPVLSIDNVTHSEGDGPDTTTYDFTVTKNSGSSAEVTVDFATADATATAPDDYAAKSGTLTFAPSSPTSAETKTFTVNVNGDTTFEPSETFTVNLSGVSNATILNGVGVGTISNDDVPPPPSMAVSDASASEGDAANFLVTLSSPPGPGQTATVDWVLEGATGDGKATETVDYAAAAGSVVYTAGEREQTISVPTIEDATHELDETFSLRLSKPAVSESGGYTYNISRDLGLGTIMDDDAAPTLSIDDVVVDPEGATGDVTAAEFTVTKIGLTDRPVTLNMATGDVTATAGSDYTASSGQLSFAPDEAIKQLSVDTTGDDLDEADETFVVMLNEPVGATLADGEGVATIKDDDAASASFAIGDVKVMEGNSGNIAATLTVTKSGSTGQITSVDYVTAGGTATRGVDYVENSGSLSFAPDETTKSITVDVIGDLLDENTESFLVDLSNATNAGITDSQGLGQILDNDRKPAMSINNGSVKELSNNSCNLTVKLSAVSGREIRVHYATANGSAGSNDYLAKSGDLTFAPGTATKVIKTYARSDSHREGAETYSVNLSGISPSYAASFADATGTCTILADGD